MSRNVLIIGASGDIGIAICKRLADDGYNLLLHYHKNKTAIEEMREHIAEEVILTDIRADLSSEADLKGLLQRLDFHIDAIIFASGTANYGLFQDVTEPTLDKMLSLHIKAPLLITQQLLPQMIQRKSGNIIFITSIWGNVGASYEVIYSTVKGAQNSFVRALAKEVSLSGISVNAISPGFIDTKMNGHLLSTEKTAILADIPMNRAGKPSEIAHTVSFLLDKQSSYIQGEVINITGGW